MTDPAQACGNCKWFKDYGNVYGDGVLWHPVKQYNGLWCGPLEPPHDQEAG